MLDRLPCREIPRYCKEEKHTHRTYQKTWQRTSKQLILLGKIDSCSCMRPHVHRHMQAGSSLTADRSKQKNMLR